MKSLYKQKNHNTFCDEISRMIPMGMNRIPMMKNAGKIVSAVIIGCQAGNRCCINISEIIKFKYFFQLQSFNFHLQKTFFFLT